MIFFQAESENLGKTKEIAEERQRFYDPEIAEEGNIKSIECFRVIHESRGEGTENVRI